MTSPPTLEALFFSGHHRQILGQTVDSPSGEYADDDVPFIVGSLVFTGRVDEALTVFRAWSRAHPRAIGQLAAARFFLCVAEARAGRYRAAERLCSQTLLEVCGKDEPRARFFLHQGLGIIRHFTGRIASAARHASRARRHALESKFPYGRMLALDLLGHARVHYGRVLSGLAILEQASELADSIGLHDFSMTSRSAWIAYRSFFGGVTTDSMTGLETHLERLGDQDRYSRRLVATELARALAYRGEAEQAALALERAEEVALPDGDRRAKVKLYLAHALLAGLAGGESAAIEPLERADALVKAEEDLALLVEMAWYEYLVAPSLFANRSAGDLFRIAARTGIARAEDLALSRSGAPPRPRSEDRFAALVRAVRDGSGPTGAIVEGGLLGLLPLSMGLVPKKRIYIGAAHRFLATEDHGNVRRRELPTEARLELLRTLARGAWTKEELIRDVWRLNVYRPQQHDAVVHTAISRLRTDLEPHSGWIVAGGAGFSLAPGVELVELLSQGNIVASLVPSVPASEPKLDARRAAVLGRVAVGETSTGEVAKLLGVSELTSRKLLSALVDEGQLERIGTGKSTRYVRSQ